MKTKRQNINRTFLTQTYCALLTFIISTTTKEDSALVQQADDCLAKISEAALATEGSVQKNDHVIMSSREQKIKRLRSLPWLFRPSILASIETDFSAASTCTLVQHFSRG